MTPQTPSGDPNAGDSSEHAAAGAPRSGAAASTFDAAQELLQAALDGVRTPREEAAPSAPEGSPRPPSAPESPARPPSAPESPARPPSAPEGPARPPSAEPAIWAALPAKSAPAPGVSEPSEFWAKPVPKTDPTPPSSDPVGTTRARRRRPAAPVATSSTDDFDGLFDTLYQPTTGAARRRRRPETGTAAAIGTAATVSAVAPKGAPAPIPNEPTQPPLPVGATTTTAPATTKPPGPVTLPAIAGAVDSPAGGPTKVPGTAAWEQAAAELANPAYRRSSPLPTEETDYSDPAPRRRTAWLIAAAIAAIVAIVAVGFVMTSGGGSDQAAVVASGKAQLRFDPITTPEGATVARSWELEGRKGSEFLGTLSFTNPTSAPLLTTFTEAIPKSLASNVSQITFDPQPIVVKADPVVQYRLTVPAGSTTTVTYAIAVAPDGVDRSRLEAWAKDLPVELSTTTTTTTIAKAPALVPTTGAPTVATSPPGRSGGSNNSNNNNSAPVRPTDPPGPAPTTPPTSPPEPPPTSPPEPPATNPPAVKGTIVIQVITRGAQPGTFGYSTPVGAISLTTSGGGASWSTGIDPGSYSLGQISTPAFFYLYEIRCSNGFASSHTTSASITVQAGETMSCTFENRPA